MQSENMNKFLYDWCHTISDFNTRHHILTEARDSYCWSVFANDVINSVEKAYHVKIILLTRFRVELFIYGALSKLLLLLDCESSMTHFENAVTYLISELRMACYEYQQSKEKSEVEIFNQAEHEEEMAEQIAHPRPSIIAEFDSDYNDDVSDEEDDSEETPKKQNVIVTPGAPTKKARLETVTTPLYAQGNRGLGESRFCYEQNKSL